MTDAFDGTTEHGGAVWAQGKEDVGRKGCQATLNSAVDEMW